MAIELDLPGIPYERQKIHELTHKGYPGGKYITDLIVDDKIIPELKAVEERSSLMDSQIIHYLKFSGVQVGCLTNFKAERIRWKRFNTRRE